MGNSTWIHIGFPKCASTSLQKDFFSQCPEIDYVGRNGRTQDAYGYEGATLRLVTLAESRYREAKEDIAKQLYGEFTNAPGRLRVVSDELLSCAYLPWLFLLPRIDFQLGAERLHEVFPDAQILMIIRNQLTFIPSLISQMERDNGVRISKEKFFDYHRNHAVQGRGTFFYTADYHRAYEQYERVFGSGRVHVVLLEDMANDPLGIMTQLVDWFGLTGRVDPEEYLPGHHNIRPSEYDAFCRRNRRLIQVLSRLVPRGFLRILAAPLKKSLHNKPDCVLKMTPEREAYLDSFYGPGNRALQAKLGGTRLADTGYPMGD